MSGQPPNPVAACVMLAPRHWALDPELDQALRRKDVDVVRVSSPLIAMAHVGRLARDARALGIILLFVEPTELVEPATLARCVERYAPRTACWMFDRSSGPRLRAVQPKDLESWAAASVTLRLAGQRQDRPSRSPEASAPSASLGLADRVAEITLQSQESPGALSAGRPGLHNPGSRVVVTSENFIPSRDSAQNGQLGQVLTKAELSMLLASDGRASHNPPG